MLTYAKFLSKRILCRKSNIIMAVCSVLIVLVFLIMNNNTQGEFKDMLKTQIETDTKAIENTKSLLSGAAKDSKAYSLYKKDIQDNESNIEAYTHILAYVEHEDWPMVYDTYRNVLKKQISITEDTANISGGNDSSLQDMSAYMKKQLTYITYLKEHNLIYENPDFPVYGLSFTTSMSQTILPVMITIFCIYISAQIFTLDYAKNMDISLLYPMKRTSVFLTKVMVSIGFSLSIYLLLSSFTFISAALYSSNAGLEYPVILQNKDGMWSAVSTLALCKDWFLLGILYCMSLSVFTYLISLLIKEDVYLLLIVLCLVLGLAYLPSIIENLKAVAHILPTTYMNYVNVANGSISAKYFNTAVTTSTGTGILTISILLQICICAAILFIRKSPSLKCDR